MGTSENFYEKLPSFSRFEAVIEPKWYSDLPADWWVCITDVRGSTQALAQGKYREVNLVGAACITAILNVCGRKTVPFVFGGDGASFAIHESHLNEARHALAHTQYLAQKKLDLHLRVGFVRVSTVNKYGGRVRVAKYEVAPGNFLASFLGGGLTLAESWIKTAEAHVEKVVGVDRDLQKNNDLLLSGLSCRFTPSRSKRGKMLSILVKAHEIQGQDQESIYKSVLEELHGIVGSSGLAGAKPVTRERVRMEWSRHVLRSELLAIDGPLFSRLRKYLRSLIRLLLAQTIIRLKVHLFGVQPERYLDEVSLNTDYQKFDEMLRLVLDCTADEGRRIRQFLEAEHRQGRLCFGIHESNEALMTCLVFNTHDNQHVHFVDGSDGGYALAAVELKRQLKGAPQAPDKSA